MPPRHVVIDHFADADDLARASACWPLDSWHGWVGADPDDPAYEGKRASDLVRPLPDFLGVLLARVAAADLGSLVGLPGCPADLSLWGSGLFAYPPGPGLAPHADADTHRRLGLRRAWSAVLFVHREWEPAWLGGLVLEGAPGGGPSGPCVGCEPGRLVAFDCRECRHHVEPVRCPEGVERRCLALFGYLPEVGPRLRPRALFDRRT